METKVKKVVKKGIAKIEEPIRTPSRENVSEQVAQSKMGPKQSSTQSAQLEMGISKEDGNKMSAKRLTTKKKDEKELETTHIGDVVVRANALAAADIMNYLNPSLRRQGMIAPELNESLKQHLWTRPGNINDIRYQTLQDLIIGNSNSYKGKLSRPATAKAKTFKKRGKKTSASTSSTPRKLDAEHQLKQVLSVTKIKSTPLKKKSVTKETKLEPVTIDGQQEDENEAETVFSSSVFERSSSHEDVGLESTHGKKKFDENEKVKGSNQGDEVASNSKGKDTSGKNMKKIGSKGKKNKVKKVESKLSESLNEFFEIQNQQVDDLHAHVYDLQDNLEEEVHGLINEIEIEQETSQGELNSCNSDAVAKFKNLVQKQKQIIRLQIDLRKRYGVFPKTSSGTYVEGNPGLPILDGYNAHFDMFAPYACEKNGKMVFYCSNCDVSSDSELLFRLHLESPQHVVKAYEEIQKSLPEFNCQQGCAKGTTGLKGSTKYFKHVTADIHAKKPPAAAVEIGSRDENNILKNFI